MNRLSTLILIGLAGVLASCGSSATSSTQAASNDVYSVAVSPDRFTLNAGDWSSISATVDISNKNSTPKAVSPQPTLKFFSSDPRVTVSPSGEVCAGQWDTRYLTCTPAVFPAVSTSAGQLDLPSGQVTITAFNASHNVSGTTFVTVHPRATSITLDSQAYRDYLTSTKQNCISQNAQVTYVATPVFVSNATGTENVFAANDYTWEVADSNVATVSSYGSVIARNPGVTTISAKLNGTVSVPLAFATCPPSAIVLGSFPFSTNGQLPAAGTTGNTGDLILNNGVQKYLSATPVNAAGAPLLDPNCNPLLTANCSLVTLPVSYITSDPLIGSISSITTLVSKLTLNTSGRFDVVVGCEPPTCNAAVADFISPAGHTTGKAAGFGYPIYSNLLGVTVTGITGSTVLVTGTTFNDGVTPVSRLLAYDSESLANSQRIGLANMPNSLVVAPNGAQAYLGSSNGLMVVNLTSFQQLPLHTYPIVGGISTDVITGKVLGVSPDSRYVVVSDVTNGLVFLIDTTGTKVATRYTIPYVDAVTFAADSSNFWIAANPPANVTGYSGVYTFASDTFVPTVANASTHVSALAWMPDGQSYFASGDQLVNYSTCDDKLNPPSLAGSPTNLSTTAINGVPRVVGLANDLLWYDYSVSTTAQVPNAAPAGDVCLSTVTVAAAASVPVPSTLQCAAQQVSFSPTLEQAFVTGFPSVNGVSTCPAESVIHGYDLQTLHAITLSTAAPIIPISGGVLNDGRKLYVGSYDSSLKTSTLHRFDLSTGTGAAGTLTEDDSVSVELIPSFVAVVPK